MFRLTIAFITIITSVSWATELYEYRIVQMVKTASSCNQEILRIVPAFEYQTGLKVYHSKCTSNGQNFDAVLTYAAENELEPVSTKKPNFSYYYTGFRYENECLKNLEVEVRNFRSQTGLEPLVSYCEGGIAGPMVTNTYKVRIEAFGNPKNRPFTFESKILPDIRKMTGYYQEKLEKTKSDRLIVSRARFFPDMGGVALSYHYYAPEKLCISNDRLLTFTQSGTCHTYQEELESILSNATERPLGLFCGDIGSKSETWLLAVTDKVIQYSNKAPQTFSSVADCENERNSVIQFYKGTLNKKVLGGLCISEKGQPVSLMLIIEKTAPKECY